MRLSITLGYGSGAQASIRICGSFEKLIGARESATDWRLYAMSDVE